MSPKAREIFLISIRKTRAEAPPRTAIALTGRGSRGGGRANRGRVSNIKLCSKGADGMLDCRTWTEKSLAAKRSRFLNIVVVALEDEFVNCSLAHS